MNYRLGTAVLVLFTGCTDSSHLQTLQNEVETLRAENLELREGQEAIKASLDSVAALQNVTTDFETLRKDWATFERAFEPSLRDELQKNIESAFSALQSVTAANADTKIQLAELEKTTGAVEALKELCVQHEAEAKKLNVIGELQQTLTDLAAKLKQAEGKVQSVEVSVRRAQTTADDAKRTATQAELKANRKF